MINGYRDPVVPWSEPLINRQFVLIFLSLSIGLLSLISWLYWQQSKSNMSKVMDQEQLAVDLMTHSTLESLQEVAADLVQLRTQNELISYFDAEDGTLKQLTNEYLTFSETRQRYDQIRFLDVNGHELVRVNYYQGQAHNISRNQLQDKVSRYYVRDTLSLPKGSIYLSPLDLNIENGQIETPYKPVIRFSTPVFDRDEKLRGMVVINYLAEDSLEHIRQISTSFAGEPMLLNNQSYWLLSPYGEDEWGFMLKEKKGIHFRAKFPGEWGVIRQQHSGQILTEQGLFTFTTLYPLKELTETRQVDKNRSSDVLTRNRSDRYRWKLLTFVPSQVLGQYSSRLLTRLIIIGSILLMLVAVGSYSIALFSLRRRIHITQLETLVHFDRLTALPNLTLYLDRLNQAKRQADRYNQSLGQLYIDIDNFKDINDTLGHQAGNQLLIQMAERLMSTVRSSDTVARLGSDEFIVLLTMINGRACCDATASKIINAVSAPFIIRGVSRYITISIGITLYPEDGISVSDILKNSDIAMHKAKEAGKNNYWFYSKKMNEAFQARIAMEHNLKKALSNDELTLLYQPKVDLRTNKITGAEALIRWYQPEKGWIGPAQFIPVAEQSKLILSIGEWVIEQACRDLHQLSQIGFANIPVAVNVSSAQILLQDVYGIITNTLADFELKAHQLEIEITETALLREDDTSKTVLNKLRQRGIKIWLDDFGTGYSSLNHLREFSVSGVKIDQAFIASLDTNANDRILVSAITGLAKSLGIATIAEGIETGQQLARLQSCQCHFGQGYLFSRPVPFQEFTKLLADRPATKELRVCGKGR